MSFFDIKVSPELTRGFKSILSKIELGIDDGLNEIGELGVNEARRIAPLGASGQYRAGLGYTVLDKTLRIFVRGSAERYVQFVEEGRRPGKFPPPKIIERWVIGSTEGRRIISGIQRDKPNLNRSQAVKAATFLVSRKIARTGTDGYEVFKRTEEFLRPRLDDIIEINVNNKLRR